MWSRLVDSTAPAERLSVFRACVGAFVTIYLAIRAPVFWALGDKSSPTFEPVGVLAWLDEPVAAGVVRLAFVTALTGSVAVTVGFRYRVAAPTAAIALLLVTTYRSSWGQLLHFENLFTLHMLLLACAPAADAWSFDARRRGVVRRETTTYGLVLQLACVGVVITYVAAGISKLRIGGLDWALGDTLRNHIAYSAVRLDLLGGEGSPLAGPAVRNPWLLPPMAAASLIVELGAPVALLGGRWRNLWVASAWLMHVGVLLLMFIGFPYPLFLVAFAPFFELERLPPAIRRRCRVLVPAWRGT
jgi:hypothetical protein